MLMQPSCFFFVGTCTISRWLMDMIVALDLLRHVISPTMNFRFYHWLASLQKSIYCCFMLEVTLKGYLGQILWAKFSCLYRIWHLKTPMGQFPCFLTMYLQFLLAQDKLLKMKVTCPVYLLNKIDF